MKNHGASNSAKNKKPIAIVAAVVAIVLVAAIVLTIVLVPLLSNKQATNEYFSAPETMLPIEDKYALGKYDYEDLAGVQTTIRADISNVTERGVKRTIPQVLPDDYALVYDTTANTLTPQYGFTVDEFNKYNLTAGNYKIDGNGIKATKISFKKYPLSLKIGETPAWSIGSGIGDNTAAIAESGLGAEGYLTFYKYMLFSQCYNLQEEAATRSITTRDNKEEQDKFKRWLKKHPAADAIYGRVLGSDGQPLNETNNNNAVIKKIIVDPLYRSLHATGLYLPAGEPVTIKIEGLKPGENIGLKMNEQDSCGWEAGVGNDGLPDVGKITFTSGNSSVKYFRPGDVATAIGKVTNVNIHNHWSKAYGRLPWIRSIVNYSENGEYAYGSPLGGVIEIDMKNCNSKVTITISGAVETPHYILGTTTPEYFDEYLRNAPGVVAILDTENGQLIGPTMEMGTTRYMRQVKKDEIDKLAMLWHSFLSVNESFTGGKYNRFNKIMFDWLVPAGAAVSMGNYSFAQPTSWFDGCMNYRELLASGNWGTLHEIGHNHGSTYGSIWGFGDPREGEVRNNALTLLAYIMFCDVGTTIRNGGGAEHGAYANPYSTLTETLSYPAKITASTDYGDGSMYHYFQMLGLYANIMHSFGAEKFYELMYSYKANPNYVNKANLPAYQNKEFPVSEKRPDFAYRCSLVYGMNFLNYFNKFYALHIPDDMFTQEQLDYIKSLPVYEPVSCFYAGGIDGVKTAGDYKVTFGDDVEFDLLGKTISTLDTAEKKGFEIVSVSQPLHGKIVDKGEGKYAYSFNVGYSGNTDEFSFIVKLSDKVQHKFTVYLRISYNGIRISQYDDVTAKNLSEALDDIYARNPNKTFSANAVGIPSYNTPTGKKETRVAEYYWRAPKTGSIKLAAKSDDWVRWYFKDSFAEIENQIAKERADKADVGGYGQISTYTNSYADNPNATSISVTEGKYYAIKIVNVNTGGDGSASVGYKYDADAGYSNFAAADIYHPALAQGQAVQAFVHEPQFIVSKKDSVKFEVTGTDKGDWKILKAPENIVGGRVEKKQQYYTEQQYFAEGDELLKQYPNAKAGDPIPNRKAGDPIPDSVTEIDRWTYLIDGQAGTNMHTTYGNTDKQITAENPHIFILDTQKVQEFNYFSVTTRNNANSYIEDCELFIADAITDEVTFEGTWKSIATANRSKYVGNTIKFNFSTQTGRYWKLVVKGTSGGKFSVLAELDAGIQSTTQKVVPVTNTNIFATNGWEDTVNIADMPSGYLRTQKKNEKVVVKFVGDSISLYSAVGAEYGSIRIIIDGVDKGQRDMNSAVADMHKLTYMADNLENKEHTMEIITTSANPVMLNIIGLPYSARLVNAPNIYLERALTIALIVFAVLAVALLTFVLLLIFLPPFRKAMLGNKLIQKYDAYREGNRKQSKEKIQQERILKRVAERSSKRSEEKPDVEPPAKPEPAKPAAHEPVKPAVHEPPARPVARPTITHETPAKPVAKPAARPTTPVKPVAPAPKPKKK